MTIVKNGSVLVGYEASCTCGWVGAWVDVPSMAGFEFCPRCHKRYTGYITRHWVDRRLALRAVDKSREGIIRCDGIAVNCSACNPATSL